jgi:hypothetical protein
MALAERLEVLRIVGPPVFLGNDMVNLERKCEARIEDVVFLLAKLAIRKLVKVFLPPLFPSSIITPFPCIFTPAIPLICLFAPGLFDLVHVLFTEGFPGQFWASRVTALSKGMEWHRRFSLVPLQRFPTCVPDRRLF